MIPEKGWPDLLRAARIAAAQEPRMHFLMVGEGAHRREYEQMSADLGIASRVTWAGAVDDPLGSGICAAADVWCQVSRWQELFGFTIAEAMAAGRPVIGTRTGGIPELIEDGVTGYLVEPGDVEAIAGRMLELAADPALRQRLGSAGRAAVARKFELKRNVRELLGVYGIGPKPAHDGSTLEHGVDVPVGSRS
jgi:glycosyltransferase involved in cell wall biosynthesis